MANEMNGDPNGRVDYRDVERLAKIFRGAVQEAVSYNAMSPRLQSWMWDFMRSTFQGAGISISTRADWLCPVPPPAHPIEGLRPLLQQLGNAKENLAGASPEAAEAVMMAECIIGDTVDMLDQVIDDIEYGGKQVDVITVLKRVMGEAP